MLTLLTWNLREGGHDEAEGDRTEAIGAVLSAEPADVVVLPECGDLAGDGRLARVIRAAGLSGRTTSAGPRGFDVGLVVRPPARLVAFAERPSGGRVPLAVGLIEAPGLGRLSVVGAHFDAEGPGLRERQAAHVTGLLPELEPLVVVLGDLNALSHQDGLGPDVLSAMSERHAARHADGRGQPATGAIRVLAESGLVDAFLAAATPGERGATVPTAIPVPPRFAPLRLDYAFITAPLVARLRSCRVVRTALAATASDHFPLTLRMGGP